MSSLVSVIIPTHNRADLLSRAIRSVLEQTYQNLECIVVDDASTDHTVQAVQQFNDDRLIYLRHETNWHTSAARNTGIARAKGDLIAFLDDDDEWLPTKLEKQVSLIQNLPPEVGMVYCWFVRLNAQGQLVSEYRPIYRGYVFPYVLDAQRIGGCPSLLVRRAVIEQVGGFDEELLNGNDGDFIRRVCLKYEVDFVPEVLVRVYIDHGYRQISRIYDEQGIRITLKGHRVKLIKFKDELPKYPKQTTSICISIAHLYSRLGDRRSSIAYYCKALTTSPFSARMYISLLRSLMAQILGSKHV